MKYPVKIRNGMVKAVRGQTTESSQYFTAFKAVIVATAFKIADTIRI